MVVFILFNVYNDSTDILIVCIFIIFDYEKHAEF